MGKGEWVKGIVKCKVQSSDGGCLVWEKYPGWLHGSGYFGARKDDRRWYLIHLRSGRALGYFTTLKNIKAVVPQLMEVKIDWAQAKRSDQKKHGNLPIIYEVLNICRENSGYY